MSMSIDTLVRRVLGAFPSPTGEWRSSQIVFSLLWSICFAFAIENGTDGAISLRCVNEHFKGGGFIKRMLLNAFWVPNPADEVRGADGLVDQVEAKEIQMAEDLSRAHVPCLELPDEGVESIADLFRLLLFSSKYQWMGSDLFSSLGFFSQDDSKKRKASSSTSNLSHVQACLNLNVQQHIYDEAREKLKPEETLSLYHVLIQANHTGYLCFTRSSPPQFLYIEQPQELALSPRSNSCDLIAAKCINGSSDFHYFYVLIYYMSCSGAIYLREFDKCRLKRVKDGGDANLQSSVAVYMKYTLRNPSRPSVEDRALIYGIYADRRDFNEEMDQNNEQQHNGEAGVGEADDDEAGGEQDNVDAFLAVPAEGAVDQEAANAHAANVIDLEIQRLKEAFGAVNDVFDDAHALGALVDAMKEELVDDHGSFKNLEAHQEFIPQLLGLSLLKMTEETQRTKPYLNEADEKSGATYAEEKYKSTGDLSFKIIHFFRVAMTRCIKNEIAPNFKLAPLQLVDIHNLPQQAAGEEMVAEQPNPPPYKHNCSLGDGGEIKEGVDQDHYGFACQRKDWRNCIKRVFGWRIQLASTSDVINGGKSSALGAVQVRKIHLCLHTLHGARPQLTIRNVSSEHIGALMEVLKRLNPKKLMKQSPTSVIANVNETSREARSRNQLCSLVNSNVSISSDDLCDSLEEVFTDEKELLHFLSFGDKEHLAHFEFHTLPTILLYHANALWPLYITLATTTTFTNGIPVPILNVDAQNLNAHNPIDADDVEDEEKDDDDDIPLGRNNQPIVVSHNGVDDRDGEDDEVNNPYNAVPHNPRNESDFYHPRITIGGKSNLDGATFSYSLMSKFELFCYPMGHHGFSFHGNTTKKRTESGICNLKAYTSFINNVLKQDGFASTLEKTILFNGICAGRALGKRPDNIGYAENRLIGLFKRVKEFLSSYKDNPDTPNALRQEIGVVYVKNSRHFIRAKEEYLQSLEPQNVPNADNPGENSKTPLQIMLEPFGNFLNEPFQVMKQVMPKNSFKIGAIPHEHYLKNVRIGEQYLLRVFNEILRPLVSEQFFGTDKTAVGWVARLLVGNFLRTVFGYDVCSWGSNWGVSATFGTQNRGLIYENQEQVRVRIEKIAREKLALSGSHETHLKIVQTIRNQTGWPNNQGGRSYDVKKHGRLNEGPYYWQTHTTQVNQTTYSIGRISGNGLQYFPSFPGISKNNSEINYLTQNVIPLMIELKCLQLPHWDEEYFFRALDEFARLNSARHKDSTSAKDEDKRKRQKLRTQQF